MSAALFIVIDRDNPGFDTVVNGKFLLRDAKRLGKIAKSLGLFPLENYISFSPEDSLELIEDMGAGPGEIAGLELPEQKWFQPEEGLDWVTNVIEYVRGNPASVRDAEGVLSDLEEYQTVFEHARSIDARWNLQVDF